MGIDFGYSDGLHLPENRQKLEKAQTFDGAVVFGCLGNGLTNGSRRKL